MYTFMVSTIDPVDRKLCHLTNDDGFFATNHVFARQFDDSMSAQKVADEYNESAAWFGQTFFVVAID